MHIILVRTHSSAIDFVRFTIAHVVASTEFREMFVQ